MSRPVRFIHAADLHLDAPFTGIDATDDRVRAALVDATYAAFERVVDACLEHDVDFLVIAGDLYNAADKSRQAQQRFAAAAERLAQDGIEVFVVHGNHDPASGWSAGLPLPETVHVFSSRDVERVEVVRDGEVICSVYGRSFGKSAETANLARGYRRDASDVTAVAVLHANVGGNTEHGNYAPCATEDLRAANMDYWALGHIHKRQQVLDVPRANYAGSPQGLNPKEGGEHGCLLVELADGVVRETFVPTLAVGWSQVVVDAASFAALEDVRGALRSICDGARDEFGHPAIVRIDLVGRCAAHAEFSRGTNLADLVAEARADELASDPWVWIARVRDLTTAEFDIDAVREGGDFAADLVRIVDSLLDDPNATAELVGGLLGPIESSVGTLELDVSPVDVLTRARDACLDRLLVSDGVS